jgi:hypothetical protein
MGANAFETGFCRNFGTSGYGWRSWTLNCWKMRPWRSFDWRNLTLSDWGLKRWRSVGWKAWRPKGTDGCSWGRCEPVTRTGATKAEKAP